MVVRDIPFLMRCGPETDCHLCTQSGIRRNATTSDNPLKTNPATLVRRPFLCLIARHAQNALTAHAGTDSTGPVNGTSEANNATRPAVRLPFPMALSFGGQEATTPTRTREEGQWARR